jgi:hypothetical protein
MGTPVRRSSAFPEELWLDQGGRRIEFARCDQNKVVIKKGS